MERGDEAPAPSRKQGESMPVQVLIRRKINGNILHEGTYWPEVVTIGDLKRIVAQSSRMNIKQLRLSIEGLRRLPDDLAICRIPRPPSIQLCLDAVVVSVCHVVVLIKFQGKVVALRLHKESLEELESRHNSFVNAEDVFDWNATLSDVITDFHERKGLGVRYNDWLSEILWNPIGDAMSMGGVPFVMGETWLEISADGDSDSDNGAIGCDVISKDTPLQTLLPGSLPDTVYIVYDVDHPCFYVFTSVEAVEEFARRVEDEDLEVHWNGPTFWIKICHLPVSLSSDDRPDRPWTDETWLARLQGR